MTTDIRNNLARLRSAIADAAHESGRPADAVKLIAVSKTHPIASLDAAIAAGQRIFGENTIQESLGKISHFASQTLEWHFIGHLQSNKVKFLPGNFSWLHSLDSLKLAQRVSRFANEKNAVVNALIEVNVTGDPAKHGVTVNDFFPLVEQLRIHHLPGIALRGLMTIGPHPAPESDIRAAYARLRALRDECQRRFSLPAFTELSMGMSGDYLAGIREGATMVRVGTAIFGERDYGMP